MKDYDKAIADLEKARDLIKARGQVAISSFYDDESKCACMAGALLLVRGAKRTVEGHFGEELDKYLNAEDPAVYALSRVTAEAMGDHLPGVVDIFEFNDKMAQRSDGIEIIIRAFNKAIRNLKTEKETVHANP